MKEKKYQSAAFVAQETGLPVSYIKRLTVSMQIPSLKVGLRYLYDLKQVQSALDDLAAKGATDE